MVKIGGASGFWGDSMTGVLQLVNEPGMQFITFDYLAELTMSLLATARSKDPDLGYCPDFVELAMKFTLPAIQDKGIRVVSNAGGINPHGCARALRRLVDTLGLNLKIAVVSGDDLTAQQGQFREQGVTDMNTGAPMPAKLVSANAYLGAFPIARALDAGADIVITGRTVDSALPLGVLIHAFGWQAHEFDKLAAGSLAGHLIECGAQATGGLFTDWQTVPDWAHIGYPVLECEADGGFTLTKPAGTGGLVSVPVLSEQMLYEIGDPANYVLPDVVCDFTQVRMHAEGEPSAHRVAVSGARGKPPTPSLKVCATYVDGYRCVASLSIVGEQAIAKARRTGEAILERTRGLFQQLGLPDYTRTQLDVLGEEPDFGPHARVHLDLRETVLRLAVCHPVKQALELFARELAPAGTSYAPGTTGSLSAGRPSVSPRVRLFSYRVPRESVAVELLLDGQPLTYAAPVVETASAHKSPSLSPAAAAAGTAMSGPVTTVRLLDIAHGRSGDKADTSNIGIIARKPEWLDVLRGALTETAIRQQLGHYVKGPIRIFEVPGIGAFNVVAEQALDGGGLSSLRADPLGKAMAQILLQMPISVPAKWVSQLSERTL